MSDRWEKSDIDMIERKEGDMEFQQFAVLVDGWGNQLG
jgi:hypothetical protein